MRIPNKTKKEYERLLKTKGEEFLYKYAVGSGFMEMANVENSDLIILDRSEAFFSLFRQTGNENYFVIGKILRRAAHRLYRHRMQSMKESEKSFRFLQLVK